MVQKYYLTKQGLKKIGKEFEDLKKLRLAKTKGETPSLLQSDDINPEYVVFREDLSFLENRIVELEHILKNIELIKLPPKSKRNVVHLGATVILQESDGQINEFKIVGTLEANPNEGTISSESPIGKILLGHKLNDRIEVNSPIKIIYKIKKINYSS
ncbi:MAG: GreA/GreB family elongation factor [Patescibacteria group bacterium]|nr:GreA/GreB family elongation factor [Patescibacteria group bacterium]